MVQFNEGDRVIATGFNTGTRYEGTYTTREWGNKNPFSRAEHQIRVTKILSQPSGKKASTIGQLADVKDVEHVSEFQAPNAILIGRAPVVAQPKYVGPFEARDDRVVDGSGARLVFADGQNSGYDEDVKLAETVAFALNKLFGYES